MAYKDDPHAQRANLRYIRSAMREPLLERETEYEYARLWQQEDDEAALHKLVAGVHPAGRQYCRQVPQLWPAHWRT